MIFILMTETKEEYRNCIKKLLQALKGVNVEEEDVSLYTTGGWD